MYKISGERLLFLGELAQLRVGRLHLARLDLLLELLDLVVEHELELFQLLLLYYRTLLRVENIHVFVFYLYFIR